VLRVITASNHLPDDNDVLKAALIEARAKLLGAEAIIEHLVIAKMKREMFGPRSERRQRLIDQLELQLEELAAERCQAAGQARSSRRRSCGIRAPQRDASFPITKRRR
jgi:transposase